MRFVGGQRDFWRGSFGAAGSGLTGPVGPSIGIMANRTSGTAPCNVFFEAAAVGTGITSPAHDLRFAWSFSDPGSYAALPEDHPQGREKNRAFGSLASHTFATPGTYTVTLDVFTGSTTYSTSVSISVADPDTEFAGDNTFAIDPLGEWTAAPSGAQTRLSLAQAAVDAKTQGRRDVRFVLRRGLVHETADLAAWSASDFDTLAFGAFGTGKRPVLSQPLTQTGGALLHDMTIRDIILRGPFDPNVGTPVTQDGLALAGGAYTTLHNLDIRGFRNGIALAQGTTNTGISECSISDWSGEGVLMTGTDNCAILGSKIAQSSMAQPAAITGGPICLSGATRRSVIWHCDLFSNAGGADHAPCVAWNADASTGAQGLIGATRLEGGHPVIQASPGTEGMVPNYGALDVDKSYILGSANVGARGLMTLGYGGTRIRNTIFVLPDVASESGADVPAFLTGGAGTVEPGNSSAPVTVQSCTFADLRSSATLQNPSQAFALREAATTDHFTAWTAVGNMDYAPELASPSVLASGVTTVPAFVPQYQGRRTGRDDLDKSFRTPPDVAALFAPSTGAGSPTEFAVGAASRDDFYGTLRAATPGTGAIELGQPITVEALSGGDIQITGLTEGQVDIDISGTSGQDTTATVTVEDTDGLPIFVSPPKTTGSTSVGDTLTAVSGMFLYASELGAPATLWEWVRGTEVVSRENSYEITQPDTVFGLRLRQNLTNAAGTAESEAEVFSQISYTETPVLPNAATLISPASLATGTPDKALMFAKFIMPPANDTGRLICSPGDLYAGPLIRTWNLGTSLFINSLTTWGAFSIFSVSEHGLVPGQEVCVLVSADLNGRSFWRLRNPAGDWHGADFALPGQIATSLVNIGSENGGNHWTTPIYRLAVWFGTNTDITDANQRENFVQQQTGLLVHPQISHLTYGQPALDFYGDAATWSGGTHQGSLPTFTQSGGSFTNGT